MMSVGSKLVLGLLGSFGLGVAVTLAAVQLAGSADRAAAVAMPVQVVVGERSLRDVVAASAGLLRAPVAPMPTSTWTGQGDAETLLAQAEDFRRKREFARACELYAALVQRGAMTADAWADYADAQATLTGGLSGEPARSIEAALALDPRHAKALWLKASLAHEQGRYDEALATWKRLLAVVPPGSSDARIVEANIAEATGLIRG
jgi:tetratricopeptide (TPR) repeat protein